MLTIAGGIILAIIILAALSTLGGALVIAVAVVVCAALIIGVIVLLIEKPEYAPIAAALVGIIVLGSILYVVRTQGGTLLILKRLMTYLTPRFTIEGAASKQVQLELLKKEREKTIAQKKERYEKYAVERLVEIAGELKRIFKRYPAFDVQLSGSILMGLIDGNKPSELFTVMASCDYPSSIKPLFSMRSLGYNNQTSEVSEVVGALKPIVKNGLIENEKRKL